VSKLVFSSLFVHHPHELLDAAVAHMLRQGIDRFGTGGDQRGDQKVADGHALLRYEPYVAENTAHIRFGLPGDRHFLIQTGPFLHHHQDRHDLGNGPYRELLVGLLPHQKLPAVLIHDRPGHDPGLRWLRDLPGDLIRRSLRCPPGNLLLSPGPVQHHARGRRTEN
jgi:hypothetical protein